MVDKFHGLFEDRVKALKRTWDETHLLAPIAGRTDRFSQFALLEGVYQWCEESVRTVQSIFGSALTFDMTPPPDFASARPSFTIALREGDALVAWLQEPTTDDGKWSVSLVTRRTDRRSGWTPVSTPRGERSWTRSRVEEVLLGLVAGFERGRREAQPRLRGPDLLPPSTRTSPARAQHAVLEGYPR